MKKMRILAAALASFMLITLAGCGGASKKEEPSQPAASTSAPAAAPAPIAAPAAPEKPPVEKDDAIHVSTPEELLNAIAPGAVVELAPGTYNLSKYLAGVDDPDWEYLRIDDGYDGVQLNLVSLEGLTLRGASGGKAEVVIEPRYADVLHFSSCSDITIENLTFGHTPEQGNCEGAVLTFELCRNVTLSGLDLYGCGTYGIDARHTTGLTVEDSVIRDCSYGIIDFYFTSDAVMKDCTFKDNEGFDMLSLTSSFVRFDGCTFSGNEGTEFLPMFPGSSGAVFTRCTFDRWESQHLNEEIKAYGGYLIGEDCTFKTAVGRRVVHVKTVEEMIDNIAPDTQILLAPGKYNLSDTLKALWESEGEHFNESRSYVRIEEEYDGLELVITGLNGLTIASESGKASDTEIVTDPRYADVLDFESCAGVGVMNITMGHTDIGDCAGDVLYFTGSSYIVLSGLDLYGCGVYGVGTNECGMLSCFDSTIRDCAYGPLELYGGLDRQAFINCSMTGSGGGSFFYKDSESSAEYYFFRCVFGEEECNGLAASSYMGEIVAEDCDWSELTEFPEGFAEGWSSEYEPVEIDTSKVKVAPFDEKVLQDEYYYLAYQTVNTATGEVTFEPDSDMKYLTFEEDGSGIFAGNDGKARSYKYAMDSDYSCVLSFEDGSEAMFTLYADQGGALPGSEEGSIWLALNIDGEVIWFY